MLPVMCKQQQWFIPWARCLFYTYVIHWSELSGLTNKKHIPLTMLKCTSHTENEFLKKAADVWRKTLKNVKKACVTIAQDHFKRLQESLAARTNLFFHHYGGSSLLRCLPEPPSIKAECLTPNPDHKTKFWPSQVPLNMWGPPFGPHKTGWTAQVKWTPPFWPHERKKTSSQTHQDAQTENLWAWTSGTKCWQSALSPQGPLCGHGRGPNYRRKSAHEPQTEQITTLRFLLSVAILCYYSVLHRATASSSFFPSFRQVLEGADCDAYEYVDANALARENLI